MPIVHLGGTMFLMGHHHAFLAFLVPPLIFLDLLHAMTSMSAKPILAILMQLVSTPMVPMNANVCLVTMEMGLAASMLMNVKKNHAIRMQIAATQRDLISAAAKQDFWDQVLNV